MKVLTSPKEAATVLTQEGFMRWAEGSPLTKKDFKPQWAYLFKEIVRHSLTGE